MRSKPEVSKPKVSKPEVDPNMEVKEEVDDGSYNSALKVKIRHTKVRKKNGAGGEIYQIKTS